MSELGLATFRRIVTGHDGDGASVFVSDGPPPAVRKPGGLGGVEVAHLWQTDATPGDLRSEDDRGAVQFQLLPPQGGSAFRIVDFPPESSARDISRTGAAEFLPTAHSAGGDVPHPTMHRTPTVDYAIVLSGECYLVLDRGETLLRAGDSVIQRGVNHAWVNRADRTCRIAFVLVDASTPQ